MTFAAGDAHLWPIYNARYRVMFPILDADGDLVTGATAPDSELSQDQGTFADATNEITEIATSSGMYYLDLIATEMDTQSTVIIVKTTTVGAKTTPIVLYPRRLPVIRTGTAQAGAATTITLDSGASAVDDFYIGCYVNITNNSPANVLGQCRTIIDYVGSTKVATIDSAWGTNPSVLSTFEILADKPGGVVAWAGTAVDDPATVGVPDVSVRDIQANAITAASINAAAITAAKFGASAIDAAALAADAVTEIANGVWDKDATGNQIQGSFGQAIGDPAADTNTIYKGVVTDAAGATIGADIVEIEGQTDDIGVAGAGLTAVPWNAAWDAEVQSEVADALDVAIPGVPVADSINQRIRSMDLLTEAAGAGDLAAILTDTGTTLDGKLPAALVVGRMDSDVGAMQVGVVTAAAVAADAIGASELATDAVNEIARAINPQVNTALSNITFEMYDSTNHNPLTGATVTGQRSLDGGAYAAVTGTIAELASGTYQIDASAADMNGALVVFRFTATGADDTFVHIKTAA